MCKKWVFKIKHNGVYQWCWVAYRYSQVLGVDFIKNYSQIVNDITFPIELLMVIFFNFATKIVNMNTTFLCRNLEEEIYMECSQNKPDIGSDDCIMLNKCIYGFV